MCRLSKVTYLTRQPDPPVVKEFDDAKAGRSRAWANGGLGEFEMAPARGVGVTSLLTGVNGVCMNPSEPQVPPVCSGGNVGRPNFPTGPADMRRRARGPPLLALALKFVVVASFWINRLLARLFIVVVILLFGLIRKRSIISISIPLPRLGYLL